MKERYRTTWGKWAEGKSLILCNSVVDFALEWENMISSDDLYDPQSKENIINDIKIVLTENLSSSKEEHELIDALVDDLIHTFTINDHTYLGKVIKDLVEEYLEDALSVGLDYYAEEVYELIEFDKSEPEFYQYFLTSMSQNECIWQCENFTGLHFVYCDKLDLYVLCVSHYGTHWSGVYMETKLEHWAVEEK